MPSIESLVFLSCGGTIEKIYRADSGKMDFDQSRIADWAKQCRIAQPWRAQTVMLIDSLEMTDGHRKILADAVAATTEKRIVVLHGTDTMVESAKTVMLHRKPEQVVVFTGAMVPASLEHSDAMFNFGLATAAVQLLHPGVYIAMSGQVFEAGNVRKNREAGVFEAIDSAASNNADTSLHDNQENDDAGGTLRITKRKMTGFFR